MNGPIRRAAYALLAIFGVLVLGVTYLQVIAGPTYRDDPRNLRVIASRTGRERGPIITADGVVVAQSIADPDDPRIFRRRYPEAELYAHVVGYTSVLFGDAGLEATWARELAANRDATISGVINAMLGGDLRPRGLRLTIDHGLQQAATAALGEQRGAVIALDPRSGAVLAIVSSPSFDPNLLVPADAAAVAAALDADPDQPRLDRAIGETYPPGSTFKILTAAAALETGAASPGTRYPDVAELALPGSTAVIRNFDRRPCGDEATVTLETAFVRSCNTVFGAIGMQLGAATLLAQAEAAGFNDEIPFDLAVTPSHFPENLGDDLPAVAQSAIGQRDVRATALQMALVGAAVANDGLVPEPRLVAEIFNADGEVVRSIAPASWRRAMSPAAAEVLTNLMERVVTGGTGRRAAVPAVRIAGKTGTAEVPDGAPHLWFVGFGPVDAAADQPQIAVAVVVESGGDVGEDATGGTVAAPIAKAVFEAFLGRAR